MKHTSNTVVNWLTEQFVNPTCTSKNFEAINQIKKKLVLPRGMPECPYVALKPQLCIHIRRQKNESKLKKFG
jgi:hypothetical protein